MSKAQIEFLQRCKALNLHSGSLNDWLDRIEELERRLEKALDILGADTQIDAEANFVALRQELDALQADNAELVAALEHSVLYVPDLATVPGIAAALAKVRKPT